MTAPAPAAPRPSSSPARRRLDRLPPPTLPEVAFAGRSNVGKSSLLNRLVGRRGLARVSKTPGRTQQINFFAVDERLLLVDLPGYGFARVPLAVKEQWRGLVEGYLRAGGTLRGVVVLVDVRRGVEPDDDAAARRSSRRTASPALLVATKIDKLGRGERSVAAGTPWPRSGRRASADRVLGDHRRRRRRAVVGVIEGSG